MLYLPSRSSCLVLVCLFSILNVTLQQSSNSCSIKKNSISTTWDTSRFSECDSTVSIEGILQYGAEELYPCIPDTILGDCLSTIDGCTYQCVVRLGRLQPSGRRTMHLRLADPFDGFYTGVPAHYFAALRLSPIIQHWGVVIDEKIRPGFQERVGFDPKYLTYSTNIESLTMIIPTMNASDLADGSLPDQLETISITESNLKNIPTAFRSIRLKGLDLSKNDLEKLDTESLRTLLTLPTLQSINLEDNNIEEFPRVLCYLPVLRSVLMNGNPITRFSVTSEELTQLEKLEVLQINDLAAVECSTTSIKKSLEIGNTTVEICVDDNLPDFLSESDVADEIKGSVDPSNERGTSNFPTAAVIGGIAGSLFVLVLAILLVKNYRRKQSQGYRPRRALPPMATPIGDEAAVCNNGANYYSGFERHDQVQPSVIDSASTGSSA